MNGTLFFKNIPHVIVWYSVVGKKESEGPLGKTYSQVVTDVVTVIVFVGAPLPQKKPNPNPNFWGNSPNRQGSPKKHFGLYGTIKSIMPAAS